MNPTAGSRRDFIKKTAAAGVLLATARVRGLAADTKAAEGGAGASSAPWAGEGLPWYRRALRWGQTNITERDVTRYDIAWWRDYWKRTAVQGVVINAGGISSGLEEFFAMPGRRGSAAPPLDARLAAIHDRLLEIFDRAEAEGRTPEATAEAMARELIGR